MYHLSPLSMSGTILVQSSPSLCVLYQLVGGSTQSALLSRAGQTPLSPSLTICRQRKLFEIHWGHRYPCFQESRIEQKESMQIQKHMGSTTENLGVCCQIVCSRCKGHKFLLIQGDHDTKRMLGTVSFNCLWIFRSKPAKYVPRAIRH